MEFSKPGEEHRFLERLVGDWVYVSSDAHEDYDPEDPAKRWTERVRSLGGLWIVSEGGGPGPEGVTMETILTVGYDKRSGNYVGTWIGSTMDYLWTYRGWVEDEGRTLVLEAEGPSFDDPRQMATYRDVISFIDDDRRTFSGSVRQADGTFKTFMSNELKRQR